MDGFDHILNWKLNVGSHPFPGKDGGTCINEAALVPSASRIGQSRPLTICRPASRDRSAGWPCSSTMLQTTLIGSASCPL